MAILKCKMCGGDLVINETLTVGVCQYCGSTMTLPGEADERKVNLFNRANHFRRNNDFDKAAGIYESILNDDNTEPEAYWGLVLCKYGIDYVEDPATKKRIPTCHRTLYGSIFADPDYKAALENADPAAQSVYEAEARTIDEIQKRILEISAKEEPFDVFICYKETNEAGTRTKDSVLAQDLYFQLKNEGFKAFFSRITLEDKLGSEYEPYIFAALNSARVMVVIGTKAEYINAPWVRNEWSRYLALINKGDKKTLIPAYRDMDPYDLPDEFSHLQAQDMSRLGFMQDLVRGIKKLLSVEQPKEAENNQNLNGQYSPSVKPLMERAFLCLEDGDFQKADDLLEQVLNMEPRNAHAYIGKLMIKLNVQKEADLGRYPTPLETESDFQKALRFAEDAYKKTLQGYNQVILDRLENERKEGFYQQALQLKEQTSDHKSLNQAASIFKQIEGYKDADALAVASEQARDENLEIIYQKCLLQKAGCRTETDFQKCAEGFLKIKGYKDSTEQSQECLELGKEAVYQEGAQKLANSKTDVDYYDVIRTFKKIPGYKDADTQIIQAEKQRKIHLSKQKKNKMMVLFSALGIIALIVIFFTVIIPNIRYDQAGKLMESGDYYAAAVQFEELGDLKDSEEQARISYYQHAQELLDEGQVMEAIQFLLKAGHYSDSFQLYQQAGGINLDASGLHTVGLKSDGTVIAVGNSGQGQLEVGNWQDIISVAAGYNNTVGLKADGSVVAVGSNEFGQLEVEGWRDIIAIAAGDSHTVGLKADGTVIAVGYNGLGQLDVEGWRDIIAIATGAFNTVGLKADGTVIAVGNNDAGQLEVENWRDIIAIDASRSHTVGLKADGSVVAVGSNNFGQLEVGSWQDIIAVATGFHHTVGLKADGSVVAVGSNNSGQLEVGSWQDIIAVATGGAYTLGIKSDGSVVAAGNNISGQLGVGNGSLFD